MTIARRFIVKGRVQGVGYRYFAISAAGRCGVVGTVRNLPDGTVEAVAEGTPAAVADFRDQLEHGPSYGRVTSVHEAEIKPTGRYKEFDVTY
jgi:acylphosphatase